ncbi:MAG: UbiX family flavin prenyltransferase [Deltaproteobacteria bacterium]|nr:UbiX family flavin prenyltransferase [Deltaproteobacteria bacterium]
MQVAVCLSGASGTIYGRRLCQGLLLAGHTVHVVASDAARRVLELEEGIRLGTRFTPDQFLSGLSAIEGMPPSALTESALPGSLIVHECDIASELGSGSVALDAVAVAPCSMASLAAVAHGTGRHLVHRLCDVAIKEHRRLVLAPRETALSVIHLENMARLARLGVSIVPCMPGFYLKPQCVIDLVDFVVDRIATHMGCPLGLAGSWQGG